jgi:carbon-monoxide dehydrogenase medium subunit
MKPAPFDYAAPDTVGEAAALLAGDRGARALAGGQSLMPLLSMRRARPSMIVDLNRIPGLDRVSIGDGVLRVGAMTRQRALERDPLVAAYAPVLPAVLDHVASVSVRNRGTVGGSLSHADRAAELPAAVVALDATIVVAGPGGGRTIAGGDFFVGHLQTSLRPGELVTEIRLPVGPAAWAYGFQELTRRHSHIALASALALVRIEDGGFAEVRLVVGGAHPVPFRALPAEARLRGSGVADAVAVDDAVRWVTDALDPPSDHHASGDYRRAVTAVLIRRAIAQAVARATREATP